MGKIAKKQKKVKVGKEAPLKEGIYCHIQVLNPPLLDLLSDVKKTGTYYEETENCRKAAILLSKKYCNRSLMGEIDYSLKIKNRTAKGVKILDKEIDTIDCHADSGKNEIAHNF